MAVNPRQTGIQPTDTTALQQAAALPTGGPFTTPTNDMGSTHGTNNLSDTNLLPWQRSLDPASQGMITGQLNAAYHMPDMVNAAGASDDATSFLQNGIGPHNGTMGMNLSQGYLDSLNQRTNQQTSRNLEKQKFATDQSNIQKQGSALAQAGSNLAQNEQIKLGNFQQQMQYQQAVIQYNLALQGARNQIVGSIFGGVGSIMGVGVAAALA